MPVTYSPVGDWNQGFSNLGAALFPNPAAVAQAGYYGAERRKALLEGNTMMDQQAAKNWQEVYTPGTGVTAPPQRQFIHPQGSPADAPAVLADPPTLPIVGGGQTPPLSSTVAGPPAAAPSGGGAPPPTPTIPPVQLADAVTNSSLTQGKPPASSSPAPNSAVPPAPNTTGSDGSVPGNDANSAVIHPGTLQQSGGGVKMAPPAQANGSPAPPAFNPQLIAWNLARAGFDHNQVNAQLSTYVVNAVQQGIIDKPTGDKWLSAFGATGPLQADVTVRGQDVAAGTSRAVANINEAGATQRQQMVIAEQEASQKRTIAEKQRAEGEELVIIPSAEPGHTAEVRRKDLPPGVIPIATAAEQAAGLQIIPVIGTDGKLTVVRGDNYQKNPGAYVRAPDAILNVDKENVGKAQSSVDTNMARMFAPPPTVLGTPYTQPGRAPGDVNAAIVARTAELVTGTDARFRNQPDAAANQAIQEAINAKQLPTVDDAAKSREYYTTHNLAQAHISKQSDPYGTKTGEFFILDKPGPGLGTTVTTPGPGTSGAGGTKAPAQTTTPAQTRTPAPGSTNAITTPNTPYATPAPGVAPETGGVNATTPAITPPAPIAPPVVSHPSQPPAPVPTQETSPPVLSNARPAPVARPPLRPVAGFGGPGQPMPDDLPSLSDTIAAPVTGVPQQAPQMAFAAPSNPRVPLPQGALDVAPAGAFEGQVVTGERGTRGVVHGGFVYPMVPTARQARPAVLGQGR
jgi:hypothetical protein